MAKKQVKAPTSQDNATPSGDTVTSQQDAQPVVTTTQAQGIAASLRGLAIKNFLATSEQVDIHLGPFTVLVGKNDVGKSSILKAINVLLGDGTLNSDCLCRFADSQIIEITGRFNPGNARIDIDAGNHTTFAAEQLLDDQGLFHVRKTWDCSGAKIRQEIAIRGPVYDGHGDLLSLNEQELIRKCRDLDIPAQHAGGGDSNAVKRRSLAEKLLSQGVSVRQEWITLATTGSGRKKAIWDGVSEVLPKYEYFRADSSLEETDTAIQNYLRKQVEVAIAECDVSQIETTVRKRLETVLGSLTEKINRTVSQDEKVTPQIEFDWTKLVKTSFRTAREEFDIPLSQRGDGFRRITMMSFFEHLAESRSASNTSIIFAFEEPETFLHPKAQEQLFETMHNLPEAGYQVILCTHSPILVASAPQTSLTHVSKDGRILRAKQDGLIYRELADDLGISMKNQFLTTFDKAKVLLLVEGVDDAKALEYASSEYKKGSLLEKTFEELNVAIIPIGGYGSVKHWVALDLLRQLSKPFFFLFDSDRDQANGPSKPEVQLSSAGLNVMTDYAVLTKRALENYIPCAVLNRLVPGANLSYGDYCKVKDICGSYPDGRIQQRLGGKSVVSYHFHNMTLNDLQEGFRLPDGADEFLTLYGIVAAKVPSTP